MSAIVMGYIEKVIRPTLILNSATCQANIQTMANKANSSGVIFRPHFKTHQSHRVGRWYRQQGVRQITVSSVAMAQYFAEDGWEDITVAFPANIREVTIINDLAKRIKINLVVEAPEVVALLDQQLSAAVTCWIKIDTGYHRTGIWANDLERIETVVEAVAGAGRLQFAGFLAHAGHSYGAEDDNHINRIYQEGVQLLQELKRRYIQRFPDMLLSYGDTPTASNIPTFEGVDEIRPGNFVFYDLAQHFIGSCTLDQIALAMACPVVALHPKEQKVILYGGAVHFSKDRTINRDGTTIYGLPVWLQENGWSEPIDQAWVKGLSQEHGSLHLPKALFSEIKVGDLIGVLPVHACLAANLMKSYLTLDGEWIDAGFPLAPSVQVES